MSSKSVIYPNGMREYIKSIASGKTAQELTDAVNEKFGPGTITVRQMQAYKKNHKIRPGIDCKFKKGCEPQNKGKPMSPEQYEKCRKTMFKKGHRPKNTRNLGEYTRTTDGYIAVKVQKNGTQRERYPLLQREVWKKYNGPIPEGMVVGFLDGNKENCSIDNLFLMERAVSLEMNQKGLRFDNAELTKTGVKIAELAVAVNRRKKSESKTKKETV